METVIVAFENSKTAWRVKEILEGGGVASCVVCRSATGAAHPSQAPRAGGGVRLQAGGSDGGADLRRSPLSCAMLVLASQNLLELMQNDDIFRCHRCPGGIWRRRYGCCCRSAGGWSGMCAPAAAGRSRALSTRPSAC